MIYPGIFTERTPRNPWYKKIPAPIHELDEVTLGRGGLFFRDDLYWWGLVSRSCRNWSLVCFAIAAILLLASVAAALFFGEPNPPALESRMAFILIGALLWGFPLYYGGVLWQERKLHEVCWIKGRVDGQFSIPGIPYLVVSGFGYSAFRLRYPSCQKGDIVTVYYLPRSEMLVGIEVHSRASVYPDAEVLIELPQAAG